MISIFMSSTSESDYELQKSASWCLLWFPILDYTHKLNETIFKTRRPHSISSLTPILLISEHIFIRFYLTFRTIWVTLYWIRWDPVNIISDNQTPLIKENMNVISSCRRIRLRIEGGVIENDWNQENLFCPWELACLMLGGSTISQGGLSVLHWQRPGLTLDRGGVYNAESFPLVVVGDQIQGGAL